MINIKREVLVCFVWTLLVCSALGTEDQTKITYLGSENPNQQHQDSWCQFYEKNSGRLFDIQKIIQNYKLQSVLPQTKGKSNVFFSLCGSLDVTNLIPSPSKTKKTFFSLTSKTSDNKPFIIPEKYCGKKAAVFRKDEKAKTNLIKEFLKFKKDEEENNFQQLWQANFLEISYPLFRINFDGINPKMKILSYAQPEKNSFWKIANPTKWSKYSSSIHSIELDHQVVNSDLKENINSIKVKCDCAKDGAEKSIWDTLRDKDLFIVVKDPGCCPVKLNDLSEFLSHRILLLIVLFVTGIVTVALSKRQERLGMGLVSTQTVIMTMACVYVHAGENSSLTHFADSHSWTTDFIILGVACVVFGLAYFSRALSIFLTCTAFTTALSWTMMFILTVLTNKKMPNWVFILMMATILVSSILPLALSSRVRQKYGYPIYTAVTGPFYLILAISLHFGAFVDLLNYQKFKKWGKDDSLKSGGLFLFVLQLVLTVVLLIVHCKWTSSNKRMLTASQLSQYGMMENPLIIGEGNEVESVKKRTVIDL